MSSDLEKEIAELRKENARLQEFVYRDELTGVSNRRGFEHEFGPLFQAALYLKEHPGNRRRIRIDDFALLYIDLDDFKSINDTKGHDEGDKVLQKIAQILQEGIRELDEVVRLGGEEFVVILLGASEESAANKAEVLCQRIEKCGVTASIGVASLGESNATTLGELLAFGDKAMYEAKHNRGKNTVVRYTELIQSHA